MPGLRDYGARYNACLAARDKAEAVRLIAEIRTAMATGGASGPGFADDLTKLADVAGIALTKAAPGRAEPMEKVARLPPDLERKALEATARIKAAPDRLAKAAAMEHGRQIKAECDAFLSAKASMRDPKAVR